MSNKKSSRLDFWKIATEPRSDHKLLESFILALELPGQDGHCLFAVSAWMASLILFVERPLDTCNDTGFKSEDAMSVDYEDYH